MYTITDKRILEDLKKSKFTWGMQLEMARKYNQRRPIVTGKQIGRAHV